MYTQICGQFGFLETIENPTEKEKIFDVAKKFYKKQGCVLTFPKGTDKYYPENLFTFSWKAN